MFTGEEDQLVSLNDAVNAVTTFQNSMSPGDKKGGYISKWTIQRILDQEECVGVRIYFAQTSAGKTVVVTGVNEEEEDLAGEENIYGDTWVPCPPRCDEKSPFNVV